MNYSYGFILGTVVFTVFGQIIIKWRIGHYGSLPTDAEEKLWFLVKVMLDPYIVIGLGSAVIASVFWVATMSRLEISQAYPFVTAGLVVLTASAGIVLFQEHLTVVKAAGIGFICVGVVLMSQPA